MSKITSSSNIAKQNKIIEQAKRDYEKAKSRGDKAGMEKAHKIAEQARKNGGTIKASEPLRDKVEISKEARKNYCTRAEVEKQAKDSKIKKNYDKNYVVSVGTYSGTYGKLAGYKVEPSYKVGNGLGGTATANLIEVGNDKGAAQWVTKVANAEAEARIGKNGVGLGAEASMVKYEGSLNVPIPFTERTLSVSGSVALGSIGAKVELSSKGAKAYVAPGPAGLGAGVEIK
ncbi:hypothetical protein [Brevibacillus thermoruber]|uniref:hypothetical protein n=1 Tax=Brevibacillus thermoruber TaxID=33942 RepID=UPI00068431EA|nr:hypothetical protein [Brevibacillus thermoruber]